MKPKKKRAPVDSTMRNVRAANKRIKALEEAVMELTFSVSSFIGTRQCEYIINLVSRKKRGKK